MPIQKLLCSTLVLLLTTNNIRANGIFRRTTDGVIVYPDSRFSGHTAAVRLYVVADNIIRVLCTPAGDPVLPDEALYGLGQHQDGWINCKGRQVLLFQNNREVAVPFLLSTRNYGILWDNYSVTTVGDTGSVTWDGAIASGTSLRRERQTHSCCYIFWRRKDTQPKVALIY